MGVFVNRRIAEMKNMLSSKETILGEILPVERLTHDRGEINGNPVRERGALACTDRRVVYAGKYAQWLWWTAAQWSVDLDDIIEVIPTDHRRFVIVTMRSKESFMPRWRYRKLYEPFVQSLQDALASARRSTD